MFNLSVINLTPFTIFQISSYTISSLLSSTYNTNFLPEYFSNFLVDNRWARNCWHYTQLNCPIKKNCYNNIAWSIKTPFSHIQLRIHTLLNQLKSYEKIFKQKKNSIPPIRYPNRTITKTNSEKSNLFAFQLENIFTPHPDIKTSINTSYIEQSLTNCLT